MGNRGQPPALHLEHPLYDAPPRPDVLEQKLSDQQIQRHQLFSENKALAGSVERLRHELAAKVQERNALRFEREKQNRTLLSHIARMEADLQGAETVKFELEEALKVARSLSFEKKELTLKAEKLTLDIQRAHEEARILPALISELKGLLYEYEQTRAAYDYQKKLSDDQLKSVQGMENKFISMTSEFEKLQAELKSSSQKEVADGQGIQRKLLMDKEVDLAKEYEKFEEELRNAASAEKQPGTSCAVYNYEKELYNHHYSTQVMGKKPVDLEKEYENFEAELRNIAAAGKQPAQDTTVVINYGHLESIKSTEKNSVNLAREVEMNGAEVKRIDSAGKGAEGRSGSTSYNGKEVLMQDFAEHETATDNDGVQQKPSTSACEKNAKRRRFREILKATEEVSPVAQKATENDHGVGKKLSQSALQAYAKKKWEKEIKGLKWAFYFSTRKHVLEKLIKYPAAPELLGDWSNSGKALSKINS